MPRLSTETTEFADLVCCFLLDKLNNPEILPGNENFDDFCELMKHKGMRAILLTYYMHMNPNTRVRYRLIREVFRPEKPMPTADLHLVKPEPIETVAPKRTLLKKVLAMGLALLTGKKIIGKVRK